ncbi:MAG: DMT family transporter [Candidatus Tisiphia sp.]
MWTGIGSVGTVVVGIMYFNEPYSAMRIFFITTMIISMIGLKLS